MVAKGWRRAGQRAGKALTPTAAAMAQATTTRWAFGQRHVPGADDLSRSPRVAKAAALKAKLAGSKRRAPR